MKQPYYEVNGVTYEVATDVEDNENSDLSLIDQNGNAVCIFSDGHLRTKNFNSEERRLSVLMEGGGMYSDTGYDTWQIADYYDANRTAMFIWTGGARAVKVPVSGSLFQFDSDNLLITKDTVGTDFFPLDENCVFVRFSTRLSVKEREDFVFLGGNPSEKKRVQLRPDEIKLAFKVDENIITTARLVLPPNYTVDGKKVPLIVWDSGDGGFVYWNSHTIGDAYSGRINGIHYLRDSGFAVLEIYSWGSYYNQKYPLCGQRAAMPIPTHIATHKAGIEYALSRYNIDSDNIFHISKSGSGKLALYYALQKPSFNLRAIYAMAPVFDDLNFVGWGMTDYRLALYEELNMRGEPETVGSPAYQYKNGTPVEDGGYNGTGWAMHSDKGKSFINENADKFTPIVPGWMNLCGQTIAQKIADTHAFSAAFWEGYTYNSQTETWSWTDPTKLPATRGDVCYTRNDLVMIGNHIPIMVIMSPTDEQTPYWDAIEVVKQLLNGGDDASMYELADGGHSGPDLSISGANYVANITTRLGVHYEGVSIGWYVACEDIFARFLQNYLTE